MRASTTRFTVGCQQPMAASGAALPPFGALVRAENADGSATYGLVGNISVEDDPFVRQLVAAGVENEEYIADQRQRRQVPVAVDVLVVGWGIGLEIYQRLPPHPPGTLDRIYPCAAAEVVRFTERHDWLRFVLAAADLPADALAVAALRAAADARPADQREAYLIRAGRELAKLLAQDLTRLDGILRQLT
ncbi:MAG: hypothetical protein ACP5UQ_11525 [Anaerolineae bacterium]